MKPSELKNLLAKAFAARLKVLIKGAPGIGKTEIVLQAAAQAGAEVVLMHPSVSDPVDFKGLPAISDGKAEFLPYGQLRKLVEASKPTICFIDDIGQAPHAVQAALMQLIHAREVDGQRISDHVVFAGATNDSSHMAGVSSILEPVKSRWDTIVSLTADADEWVAWALQAKIAPSVVAFIRFRPALLNDFRPTRELKNSPCPRTVEAVGRWVASGIEDHSVIAGAAGEGFAAEFGAFLQVWRSVPDVDALLANPSAAHVPSLSNPSMLVAVASAVAYRATPANFAAVITYLSRLPQEYSVMAVRDATARDPKLNESPAYTKWVIENQEVFA